MIDWDYLLGHGDIIILHVNINYLACKGNKYATTLIKTKSLLNLNVLMWYKVPVHTQYLRFYDTIKRDSNDNKHAISFLFKLKKFTFDYH